MVDSNTSLLSLLNEIGEHLEDRISLFETSFYTASFTRSFYSLFSDKVCNVHLFDTIEFNPFESDAVFLDNLLSNIPLDLHEKVTYHLKGNGDIRLLKRYLSSKKQNIICLDPYCLTSLKKLRLEFREGKLPKSTILVVNNAETRKVGSSLRLAADLMDNPILIGRSTYRKRFGNQEKGFPHRTWSIFKNE